MSDRANIVVTDGVGQVALYSHWSGTELPEILRKALIRGKGRWGDAPYLTRIIFSEMIKGDVMGETGYGISTYPTGGDGDRVLLVDAPACTVKIGERPPIGFPEYVRRAQSWEVE